MPFADPRQEIERRDRGLAGERTTLAWDRTALSLAAVAALLASAALRRTVGVAILPGSAALLGIAITARRTGRQAYQRSLLKRGGSDTNQAVIRLVSRATAASAVLAALVTVLPFR
jgi:uncharacterized membrane protein YidH (DUF202 family)